MSIVKQLAENVIDGRVSPPVGDPTEEACPLLWELLTFDQYQDDKRSKRMLPEISITRLPGGYQVTVKDHETCQAIACFAETLPGIGQAIERALTDPTKAWTPFRSYRNSKGPHVPENGLAEKRRKKVN